jgi:exodeoxyribonuclease-3
MKAHLPVLIRWLKDTSPDIVCLQELRSPQEKFPEKEVNELGYNAIWHSQKGWNGVAILTRGLEVSKVKTRLPGDPDDSHCRYIEAKINDVLVGCIYLPNGNPAPGPKFDYKLKWFRRLNAYAKRLLAKDIPVVLAGDFNVIPTDLDAYKPEHWLKDALFFPESKAAYKKLVEQGWTDALRKKFPKQKVFTFWDYFRNAYPRDAGIRIDHILLSPHFKRRLIAAGVDREVRGWETTSDHAPVWIELKDFTRVERILTLAKEKLPRP